MDQGAAAILRTDPWFSALPEACKAPLIAAATPRTFADGAAAYRIGDPPEGLLRVISGEIRLISYPTPGRHLVNLTVKAGDWFGELSTLDGGPRPHDALAHGPAAILHFPQQRLEALAEETPGLYRAIALLCCRHQRAALDYIGSMLSDGPRARLARTLLALARAGRPEGPTQVLTNQEDLAGRLGVARQTLSPLLRDFQEAGLIRRAYRRIEILDPAGLARMAPE